jgi:cysteine synthase
MSTFTEVPSVVSNRLRGLSSLIGNTPLLAIEYQFRGRTRVLYAKSEQLNMTGSIKDRMALHILRTAYQNGSIRPGDTIVEATSGNTGISFAAIGRALGHPVTIFMPEWMSRERKELIRSLGAQIRPVTQEEGGFRGSISMAESLAAERRDVFLPQQFSSDSNVCAHETTTGPEIWGQLKSASLKPAAFVAGVGTGGTIMGVARFLKKMNPAIRMHPLQPAESPTLSTGCKVGHHRIQGISDEFIPPIVNLDSLDDVISVNDGDAILMAQKLANQLGLAVGISSGANFLGAVKVQNELEDDAVVATVFPDDNKKYLSTDLLAAECCKDDYLSQDITLIGFDSLRRVCEFCDGRS